VIEKTFHLSVRLLCSEILRTKNLVLNNLFTAVDKRIMDRAISTLVADIGDVWFDSIDLSFNALGPIIKNR